MNSSGSLLAYLSLGCHSSAGGTFPRSCLPIWGHREGWASLRSTAFTQPPLYLHDVPYLLLRLAVFLGSPAFPWEHLILAHCFSCPAPNPTCCIGVLKSSKANIPACPRGRCSQCHEPWRVASGRALVSVLAFELLFAFGVIPDWPLKHILGLWIAQLWWRLKALIAKLW